MLVASLWACFLPLHAQPALQITSPVNGAVFSPGQTVAVTVNPSGSGFSYIGVFGEDPLGFSALVSTAPYQFSLPIPTTAVQRQYRITAVGVIGAAEPVFSPSITITVQRSDAPVTVRVEPAVLQLRIGQKAYLRVVSTYGDGSTAVLTKSASTTYTSNSTAIATVNNYGAVTAVGSGATTILVNGVALVPITVAPAMKIAPVRKVLHASQSQRFFPTMADSSVPSVVWSLNPGNVGNVSGTGVYTAPATITSPQTVTVTATSTVDGITSATATISLQPSAAR